MKIEKTSNREISSHLAEPNQSVQNTGTYFFFLENICFVHSIFRFWFLVTFGDEVMKILHNLKWKENHATKVTKIPKDKNMG